MEVLAARQAAAMSRTSKVPAVLEDFGLSIIIRMAIRVPAHRSHREPTTSILLPEELRRPMTGSDSKECIFHHAATGVSMPQVSFPNSWGGNFGISLNGGMSGGGGAYDGYTDRNQGYGGPGGVVIIKES